MANKPLKSITFPGLSDTYTIPQAASDIGAIEAPASPSNGDVLTYNSTSGDWEAQAPGGGGTTEIFWATYGTTTSAELEAAYQAGKIIFVEKDTNIYRMDDRVSATDHSFHSLYHNYRIYYMYCVSDTWSTPSYKDIQTPPSPATAAPQPLGTAAVGTSTSYARADHVHKKPTASDLGITVPSAYTSNPAALGTASPGSSTSWAKGDHVHAMPSAADVGAVAVAQGVAHAGEFAVVGSDGNITTVTMATWQGGSY